MERHEGKCGERGGRDHGRVSRTGGVPGPRGVHVRRTLSEAPRAVARGGMQFAILDMLKEKPRHGYDIIRAMEEASGGLYSPSPGAIYPRLQSLEDEDLVSSTQEEGKRVYAITEAGTEYLQENKEKAASHRERWESNWGQGEHGSPREFAKELHDAMHVFRRAVHDSAGDADKIKEMGEVLREAASKIEEIAGR